MPSLRHLDKIFRPGRVAVIGASDRPGSVGYTLFHNLIGSGYRGVVYPVNATREAVQGVHAYPSVAALPNTADLAVIATPAATVPALIRECGEAGIRGIIVISAGFREVGPAGIELEQQILDERAKFPGMRIVGPNCLGIIVPDIGLNASFAAGTPKAGHIAFLSQSGALCTSVLDWALQEDIGFSYFVSIGNCLDVGFGELIDYFGQRPETKSMILYAESIRQSRQFMSAARAFARTKPIVAYKSGRFAESAAAAASHTGALAGEDAVYDAAFERAGIVRVSEIDDIFDCAELLARHKLPKGPRLAIVTNAGGPGVMATDSLIARDGQLAKISENTVNRLNEVLPPFWSHSNPIDVLGDADAERFAVATEIVLEDENVDSVLVILTPQAMTEPTETAQKIGAIAGKTYKPVIAAWVGGRSVRQGLEILAQAQVPAYSTPEQGVRSFMHLVSYARNLQILYETPRDLPLRFNSDRQRLRGLFDNMLLSGQEILSEEMAKTLLEAYEIPVIKPYPAPSAEEAVEVASRIGYPVVLKILSPQITHKTDVNGVLLNLKNDEEVRAGFERIVASAREKMPHAVIEGVTVQRMFTAVHGVELIIGAKKDPTFGAAIMVGAGGIAAEVFRDRALGLPPLNERLARRMLESLHSWPLLQGYRGKPGVNIDQLIEVLMRMSYLVAECPEIKEIDINPLMATPDEMVALDARIVIDRELVGQPVKPYSHLAIRPYPEEYVREVTFRDNQPGVLRPIKPEDEPLWHELLHNCSAESIRSRFQYLFKRTTHEMASRYCFLDYDREMAIVAEVERAGKRELIGVGRLVADPEHEDAEYAVLVADAWQDRGVGGRLTDYCLEIAKDWGLQRVVGRTTLDNSRMIALFENRGFEVHRDFDDGLMLVQKNLQ